MKPARQLLFFLVLAFIHFLLTVSLFSLGFVLYWNTYLDAQPAWYPIVSDLHGWSYILMFPFSWIVVGIGPSWPEKISAGFFNFFLFFLANSTFWISIPFLFYLLFHFPLQKKR